MSTVSGQLNVVERLASLALLLLTLGWGQNVIADSLSGVTDSATAAKLDWREHAQLDDAKQKTTPEYCGGAYIVPDYLSQKPVGMELGAVYLAANRAEGDMDEAMELSGNVNIIRDLVSLKSDWAKFNALTEEVALEGNILLRTPEVVLTGGSANYSTKSSDFNIESVSYLFYEMELRGAADSLYTEADRVLHIENGSFTTCPPENTDWAIAASNIELDRNEGFGTAKHATLRIKDIPVAYFPYFTFPIDDRRKSGFLYPSIGSSNAGSGLYFSAPYYLNLAPDYDATYTPTYIHGRGLLTELEMRHLSSWGGADLDLGYINRDDDYEQDSAGNDPERWGLAFNNASVLDSGVRSSIAFNAVSDDDYLSDLNRSLDINEVSHLERQWKLSYRQSDWDIYGLVNGYQTIDDAILPVDEPYARLPQVGFNFTVQPQQYRYFMGSEYVYFYRDNDLLTGADRTNGQRLSVIPGVGYDYERLWGFLRSAVKVNHTDYFLDDQLEEQSSHLSRTLPVATADAGLYFDRDSFYFNSDWSQTLEPRLFYAYVPFKDQSLYPNFDSGYRAFSFASLFEDNRFSGGDRVGDSNRLSAAITSRLNDKSTGKEIARISFGQVYFFDDRQVSLDGQGAGRRSDSPFAAELGLKPAYWLDLSASSIWDARESNTEESAVKLRLHTEDYRWVFNAGHRYLDDELEQSELSAIVPVGNQISLFGSWLYELGDKRTIGSVAGVEYESCCWRVQLFNRSYLTSSEQVDHSFLLKFELKGLGGIESGGSVGSLIDGYEQRERVRPYID